MARDIRCEKCGGEGKHGNGYPGTDFDYPCEICDGTGRLIVAAELVADLRDQEPKLSPMAVVSAEIADAFGMEGLPNTSTAKS